MQNISSRIYKGKDEAAPELTVRVYTDRIVRFTYGQQAADITDSIVLEPQRVECRLGDRNLELPDFMIDIGESLELTITDRKEHILLRDTGPICYRRKDREDERPKREYEILNSDRFIDYAYRIRREISWEQAFFGLGEKYGPINLKGRATENWNTDVLGVSPVHTAAHTTYHTNIPFYIGAGDDRYYGLFYRSSYRNSFDFGKYSPHLTFEAAGGLPDFFFLYGETLGDIVRGYTLLTGRMPLPRRDFLGYHQCRWSYNSSREVLDLARSFREREIPSDVIYLDIDYMEHYKVFTQDPGAFADFDSMIDKLQAMNFKLVVIIDPGVKVEEGYEVYDSGKEKDYFIKAPGGGDYIGKVWPGESVYPDYLRSEVRNWWGRFIRDLSRRGVAGIWNDMNEPSDMSSPTKTLPEDCIQLTDRDEVRLQKETHNLYGHYQARATYEALIEKDNDSKNIRPFVLTRSASAGTQRYSALWTGDNASLWEHLSASIPMLLNLGLSGIPFAGSDIGGFVGDCEAELLIRWSQLGVCYPLCRNHSAVNTLHQEPWSFGSDTENAIRDAVKLRYSLISEFYQLFCQSATVGDPVVRPLAYHYDTDEEVYNIDDQLLIGRNLLAAPVTKRGARRRMIYLPEGRWYDYYTDQRLEGGWRIVSAPIDRLPLYVREGAILLRDHPRTHLGGLLSVPEIHLYAGADSERILYFDDGLTDAYRNGSFTKLKAEHRSGELSVSVEKKGYPIGDLAVVRHGF